MNQIETLAWNFRKAIDAANKLGKFKMDIVYKNFPYGCCGDTSDLLAEYLLENGVKTFYVCGTYIDEEFEKMQSHAWLCTDGEIIVDITGDQFKYDSTFLNYNNPVYVGKMDEFHKLFIIDERDIHECYGLSQVGDFNYCRLKNIYDLIKKML